MNDKINQEDIKKISEFLKAFDVLENNKMPNSIEELSKEITLDNGLKIKTKGLVINFKIACKLYNDKEDGYIYCHVQLYCVKFLSI